MLSTPNPQRGSTSVMLPTSNPQRGSISVGIKRTHMYERHESILSTGRSNTEQAGGGALLCTCIVVSTLAYLAMQVESRQRRRDAASAGDCQRRRRPCNKQQGRRSCSHTRCDAAALHARPATRAGELVGWSVGWLAGCLIGSFASPLCFVQVVSWLDGELVG
eukprot:364676-Chlamydomonas_euryale.AAC.8